MGIKISPINLQATGRLNIFKMENRKKLARIKSRAQTRDKDKSLFNIFVKLFTDEKFPLKGVSNDMKIKELKQYMEFATGIPVHMQRISYLDDGKGNFTVQFSVYFRIFVYK